MDRDSISTHAAYEETYWWFVGRRKVISTIGHRYLTRPNLRILDWGCGAGGNFKTLAQFGTVSGVDSSPAAVEFCKKRGFANVKCLARLDQLQGGLKFDMITCFDVLEHLEDDGEFLRQLHEFIDSNAFVFVTIPAHEFLWSQLDEVLGHVRRYSRKRIIELFEQNGFQVIRVSYFFALLSPLFVVARIFQKKTNSRTVTLEDMIVNVPSSLNLVFIWLMTVESFLLRWINLPLGTSLLLLAKPCR